MILLSDPGHQPGTRLTGISVMRHGELIVWDPTHPFVIVRQATPEEYYAQFEHHIGIPPGEVPYEVSTD